MCLDLYKSNRSPTRWQGKKISVLTFISLIGLQPDDKAQALVSLKNDMPPPLPYFKVNICPFPLPHFTSMTQLYRYTLKIFLFSTATLKYIYRAPSDKLDKNIERTSLGLLFSHWNGLCMIFHMPLEFSRPAMCNNAIMIISSQM